MTQKWNGAMKSSKLLILQEKTFHQGLNFGTNHHFWFSHPSENTYFVWNIFIKTQMWLREWGSGKAAGGQQVLFNKGPLFQCTVFANLT